MNLQLKPIPGFPRYKAGSDGNIYSYPIWHRPRVLKRIFNPRTKYFSVRLWHSGKTYSKDIHRLICVSFMGYPLGRKDASHLNGDRSDNRAANLIWETRRANHLRKIEHGTDTNGVRHYKATFNKEQLLHIRVLLKAQVKAAIIAKELRCSYEVIRRIKTGEHYGQD